MLRAPSPRSASTAGRTPAARPAGRWRHAGTAAAARSRARRIRTVTSRTLWLDSFAGHALLSLFWSTQCSLRPRCKSREGPMTAADTERFRLRRFVERLVQLGECDIHDKPIDLVDVAAVLEGNPRATWFKAVGPGEGGADRQRHGVAQAAGAGARHRRGRADAGAGEAARQSGEAGEGRRARTRRCSRWC